LSKICRGPISLPALLSRYSGGDRRNGDASLIGSVATLIANPDLPKRIGLGLPSITTTGAPSKAFDARGYTDYPGL